MIWSSTGTTSTWRNASTVVSAKKPVPLMQLWKDLTLNSQPRHTRSALSHSFLSIYAFVACILNLLLFPPFHRNFSMTKKSFLRMEIDGRLRLLRIWSQRVSTVKKDILRQSFASSYFPGKRFFIASARNKKWDLMSLKTLLCSSFVLCIIDMFCFWSETIHPIFSLIYIHNTCMVNYYFSKNDFVHDYLLT